MKNFVLFDAMSNDYVSKTFGKSVPNWIDAKQYKRLHDARNAASLMNISRNLPTGVTVPNKYYQNLPNVEVHEYDAAGNLVQLHLASPDYIYL
jgi:hypothetical protein